MSEAETKNETTSEDALVNVYNELRKFEVELETGEKRWAEIRLATMDEQRRAEEYSLQVIAEKAHGEPDPITGKVIKLPTRENMIAYAKEKGMWTDEDDVTFASLETQIRTKTEQLSKGKVKLSRAYEIATQLIQDRREIAPLYRRRWEIYGLTADAAGEEAYHRYLCVATSVWENGERIFPDIASLDKASEVRNQVLARYWGLIRVANELSATLDKEVQFLHDYGFMDKKGNVYDLGKKEVVLNLYGTESEDEAQGDTFAEFVDDTGNVIEKQLHPSFVNDVEAQSNEAEK